MKRDPIIILIFSIIFFGAQAQAEFSVPRSHAIGICHHSNNGELRGARIFEVGGRRYEFSSRMQVRMMCRELNGGVAATPPRATDPAEDAETATRPENIPTFMGGGQAEVTPEAPATETLAPVPPAQSPEPPIAESSPRGGVADRGPNPCNNPDLTANIPTTNDLSAPRFPQNPDSYLNYAAGEVRRGNIPNFQRNLVPVNMDQGGGSCMGTSEPITLCRMPQPLAIGTDSAYSFTPIDINRASSLAREMGFILPTPAMVDASMAQSEVRLGASPRPWFCNTGGDCSASRPSRYREQSDSLIRQISEAGGGPGSSVSGIFKNYTLVNGLGRSGQGFSRLSLYGWPRGGPNGRFYQNGGTPHEASFVDYSQTPTLWHSYARVNGRWEPLTSLLQDSGCAATLNRSRGTLNASILEVFNNPSISAPGNSGDPAAAPITTVSGR